MFSKLPNCLKQSATVVALAAVATLMLDSQRCDAAISVEIDNVTFTPGQTAEFSVYAEPTFRGDTAFIAGFDLVLNLNQVAGNASIGFTNSLTDDDLTGNPDYIFSQFDPFDILTNRIGDANVDPLIIGRSDVLDDIAIPLFEIDDRYLIGRFQLADLAAMSPGVGDQFQISVDLNNSRFLDDIFEPIAIDGFTGGLVTVSAVPEPSSFLAMGIVASFVGYRRRRRTCGS